MRQSSGRASIVLLLASLLTGCGGSSAEGEGPKRSGAATLDDARPASADVPPAATEVANVEAAKDLPPTPDGPRVYVFDGYEKIYIKPDPDSAPIGLIRAGSSVPLATGEVLKGLGVGNCKGAFYQVKPRGYVCTGRRSTTDGKDARVRAAMEVLPRPDNPRPFRVGFLLADSPRYARIPTVEEQKKHEPGLEDHFAKIESGKIPAKQGNGSLDVTKAGKGPSKTFLRYLEVTKPALLSESEAYEGRKMAFAAEFDAEGRTFLVAPDLTLVPKDKVRFVEPSQLKGVDLKKGEMKFPFAYTWIQDTPKLKKQENGEFKETGEVYPKQTFVQLEGNLVGGPRRVNYWKTTDGSYVRNELVSVFKDRPERPIGIGKTDKWIDVRVTWGTLVAYEGETPVYATAISPGQDGINVKSAHTTRLGQHQIGWKLVTADMTGVEKGKPWAVDDVPFVAYYKDSYAVHGAWWHDDFGRPKSHGCVNVAPNDAHFLWHWMDPAMPDGWYAVAAFRPDVKGTTVWLRP